MRVVRGVSSPREGSKILTFLFGPRLVCSLLLDLHSSWKVNSPRSLCCDYFVTRRVPSLPIGFTSDSLTLVSRPKKDSWLIEPATPMPATAPSQQVHPSYKGKGTYHRRHRGCPEEHSRFSPLWLALVCNVRSLPGARSLVTGTRIGSKLEGFWRSADW
jgi:hypothetical protein